MSQRYVTTMASHHIGSDVSELQPVEPPRESDDVDRDRQTWKLFAVHVLPGRVVWTWERIDHRR